MNKLREIRVIKRITQFQLRLQTGIHQSKISMIENSLIEPGGDERKRIAKALGVKVEEIFPFEGDESEKTSQGQNFSDNRVQ